MPFREYLCDSCGHQFEELVKSTNPEDYKFFECPHCGEDALVLPALIGGYQGNMGGGSTRRKYSSAMPKGKVFTGNKEPKGE